MLCMDFKQEEDLPSVIFMKQGLMLYSLISCD